MALLNIQTDRLVPTKTQSVTASSSTVSIDLSLGEYVILTLSATVTTMNISNWPSGYVGKLTLEVRSTGAYNITGWASAKWAAGTAPTVTSGNGKRDIFVLFSGDGGTNTYGAIIAQNCS